MALPQVPIGPGPTKIIALHGWFGSARGWGMLPDLVDQNAYSRAFLDYRGSGERETLAAS